MAFFLRPWLLCLNRGSRISLGKREEKENGRRRARKNFFQKCFVIPNGGFNSEIPNARYMFFYKKNLGKKKSWETLLIRVLPPLRCNVHTRALYWKETWRIEKETLVLRPWQWPQNAPRHMFPPYCTEKLRCIGARLFKNWGLTMVSHDQELEVNFLFETAPSGCWFFFLPRISISSLAPRREWLKKRRRRKTLWKINKAFSLFFQTVRETHCDSIVKHCRRPHVHWKPWPIGTQKIFF